MYPFTPFHANCFEKAVQEGGMKERGRKNIDFVT